MENRRPIIAVHLIGVHGVLRDNQLHVPQRVFERLGLDGTLVISLSDTSGISTPSTPVASQTRVVTNYYGSVTSFTTTSHGQTGGVTCATFPGTTAVPIEEYRIVDEEPVPRAIAGDFKFLHEIRVSHGANMRIAKCDSDIAATRYIADPYSRIAFNCDAVLRGETYITARTQSVVVFQLMKTSSDITLNVISDGARVYGNGSTFSLIRHELKNGGSVGKFQSIH